MRSSFLSQTLQVSGAVNVWLIFELNALNAELNIIGTHTLGSHRYPFPSKLARQFWFHDGYEVLGCSSRIFQTEANTFPAAVVLVLLRFYRSTRIWLGL